MKRIKYYIFLLLGMASLASCSDELKENVSMNVGVKTEEGVTVQGNEVTVKAGTSVVFNISGDPDNISFWSGEEGSAYANKDRIVVDTNEVKSSTLHFKIWARYGNGDCTKDVLHMYMSENFPGIAGNDFEADAKLMNEFQWTDFASRLTDKDGKNITLPQAPVGNIKQAPEYSVNITDLLGKRIAFAFHYQGLKNTAAQPRFEFSQFYIENKMKNGTTSKLYAGDLGFTPINMQCKENLEDQRGMTTNREYGSVTNNVSGIWNLTDIKNGNFAIHSSAANKALKNSWLVSNLFVANACSPDKGLTVKNMSQSTDSYKYTYTKPGKYTATFIGTNSNFKHESRVIRELTINVTK